jgi:hypothetical protein
LFECSQSLEQEDSVALSIGEQILGEKQDDRGENKYEDNSINSIYNNINDIVNKTKKNNNNNDEDDENKPISNYLSIFFPDDADQDSLYNYSIGGGDEMSSIVSKSLQSRGSFGGGGGSRGDMGDMSASNGDLMSRNTEFELLFESSLASI